MQNINFMVETRSVGGGGKGTVNEYEVWASVNHVGSTAVLYEGTSHALTTRYDS